MVYESNVCVTQKGKEEEMAENVLHVRVDCDFSKVDFLFSELRWTQSWKCTVFLPSKLIKPFLILYAINFDNQLNNYTECPTRYGTRHFFNNFTTNEDTAHYRHIPLHFSHNELTPFLIFVFPCIIIYGFIKTSLMHIV